MLNFIQVQPNHQLQKLWREQACSCSGISSCTTFRQASLTVPCWEFSSKRKEIMGYLFLSCWRNPKCPKGVHIKGQLIHLESNIWFKVHLMFPSDFSRWHIPAQQLTVSKTLFNVWLWKDTVHGGGSRVFWQETWKLRDHSQQQQTSLLAASLSTAPRPGCFFWNHCWLALWTAGKEQLFTQTRDFLMLKMDPGLNEANRTQKCQVWLYRTGTSMGSRGTARGTWMSGNAHCGTSSLLGTEWGLLLIIVGDGMYSEILLLY